MLFKFNNEWNGRCRKILLDALADAKEEIPDFPESVFDGIYSAQLIKTDSLPMLKDDEDTILMFMLPNHFVKMMECPEIRRKVEVRIWSRKDNRLYATVKLNCGCTFRTLQPEQWEYTTDAENKAFIEIIMGCLKKNLFID